LIRLIQARNFRCLKKISQPLDRFHVLVGPNASGKTTFLDVVAFLGQLLSDGLEQAVRERTENFGDLVWGRAGSEFELAIEAAIPEDRREHLDPEFDTIRYEIAIGLDPETGEACIPREYVLLKRRETEVRPERPLFPMGMPGPQSIVTGKAPHAQRVITKSANDNFYSEVRDKGGKGWFPAIKLGPRKSAFANLPDDETKFPVSTWLRDLLTQGVQTFILNSLLIRKASPPGRTRGFKPDGSNLPWVIADLQSRDQSKFREWIAHIQTALPEIENIRTVLRPDDNHRYLVLCYQGGLEVPSWMASDGTLRLLALTLPAYLSDFHGVYLIEEPENGIHPRAIESVLQSLSSVYDAQILLATHSPVILASTDAKDVLCFARTQEGATDIVSGDEHPALREWRGETDLGTLFAGGVLG